MLEKIDENFIKRLRLIARGIARGNCDPDELVNESVEYLLKNKDRYKNHPNPIALAVLKMKALYIDFIRKNKIFLPTRKTPLPFGAFFFE